MAKSMRLKMGSGSEIEKENTRHWSSNWKWTGGRTGTGTGAGTGTGQSTGTSKELGLFGGGGDCEMCRN